MSSPARARSRIATVLLAALACACGGGTAPRAPDPGPSPSPSDPAIPVSGAERIGWTQAAESLSALRALQFAAYVDSAPTSLPGWSCADAAVGAGYDCSAPLPAMSRGQHSLSIAAVATSPSGPVEARSQPLLLNVGAAIVSGLSGPEDSSAASGEPSIAADAPELAVWATGPGRARGLAAVSDDLALVIAGARRLVAVTAAGSRDLDVPLPAANATIADVAAPPGSADSHMLVLAWRQDEELQVIRYREVGGRLGEAATIVTGLALQESSLVRMRYGPDGKLYVAVSAGDADERSLVFRFNPDGGTPREHRNASPAFAAAASVITSLAWHPRTHDLWIAGHQRAGWGLRVYESAATAAFDRLPLRGTPADGTPALRISGEDGPAIAFAPATESEPIRLLLGAAGTPAVRSIELAHDGRLAQDSLPVSGVPGLLARIDVVDSGRLFVLFGSAREGSRERWTLATSELPAGSGSRLP